MSVCWHVPSREAAWAVSAARSVGSAAAGGWLWSSGRGLCPEDRFARRGGGLGVGVGKHEAWSGWWCYLDGKLACPFEAECICERRGSPLKIGERVTLTAMLDDDEAAASLGEILVEIVWQGRTLGVPLAQLRGMGVNDETAEAIADCHYWIAQGRQF